MATGFPTKANWVSGDILTAAQMDDLAGTVNALSNASATSGSVLVSNVAGTSFAYQPLQAAGKNAVINGGMDIWQRGTSVAIAASTSYTAGFSADRWDTGTGANQAITISRQVTGDTTNLPNIQYAMRYQRNSGQTGVGGLSLANSFESSNSIPFAGKTVTLSYYARAGANYSSASSALGAALYSGTGTDQNRLAGAYTGDATPISSNITLTTTWQRFTVTGTVASTATELSIIFSWTPSGTAGANDYFEITGVQLELGSVATTFSRAGGTLQGELAACQRYYWRTTSTGVVGTGLASGTSNCQGLIRLPVTMRISPTALDYSAPTLYDGITTTTGTVSTLWAAGGTNDGTVNVGAAATLTTLKPYFIAVGASGYYGFSAEL